MLPTLEQVTAGFHDGPPFGAEAVPDEYMRRVRAALPGAVRLQFREILAANEFPARFTLDRYADALRLNIGHVPTAAVATAALLDFFDVPDRLRTRLSEGEAVVIRPPGPVRLTGRFKPDTGVPVLRVAGVVKSSQLSSSLPRVLIGKSTAATFG